MEQFLKQVTDYLRGAALRRALTRNRQAADALDAAVKEMLKQ